MDSTDEFEFWCAEYRDNPRMAAVETNRLLRDMCSRGNPLALEYLERLLPEESTVPEDHVSFACLAETEHSEHGSTLPSSVDDLDGNDWAARIGAIESGVLEGLYGNQPNQEAPADYVSDWEAIATHIKNERGWKCEICQYQRANSGLLQVHHIDGDKSDNKPANLQVLCANCHAEKHQTTTLWPADANEAEKAELNLHHRKQRIRR